MADVELKPLPPAEALAYFRGKGFRLGWDWRDTWQAQHAGAFTVAKATSLDILVMIRAELDKALAQGRTFEAFRADLQPLLEREGWWGRKAAIDPDTGQRDIVQLGSPRRLRTIYDVNVRMAMAAGKWARIEAVAPARPYLRYVAVMDERTRHDHRQWHGTILRWDDPWWREHYPPNGWNCRCTVMQLSERDLARNGWKVSPSPKVSREPWVNKRTGATVDVPAGIDPGFAYNVGRAGLVAAGNRLRDKLDAAPADLAQATIAGILRSREFAALLSGRGRVALPVGQLDMTLQAALDARGRTIMMSADDMDKQRRKGRADLDADTYAALLPQLLGSGEAISQDNGTKLLLVGQAAGRWYQAVVKRTASGEGLFLNSFRRTFMADVNRQRGLGTVVREATPGGSDSPPTDQ